MTEKCGKCDLDIAQVKDSIKCTDCNVVYHLKCSARGSETANKVSTRTSWKCGGCTSDKSSGSSKGGLDRTAAGGQAAVLEAIAAFRQESNDNFAAFRQEINAKWETTNNKLDLLKTEMGSIKCDMDGVKNELEVVKRESNEASKKANAVEVRFDELERQVANLRKEMDSLQQHSRVDNVIITGIPFSKGEDVNVILKEIATLLNINYNRYDVSAAHRLPSADNRPPPIVVKFVSRTVKNDWVVARRTKKSFSARDLHPSLPDTQIYFNEHMTALTRGIFNMGRELVKENRIASIWVRDGRVLVKKTPTGKPVRVYDIGHLRRIVSSDRQPTSPQSGVPTVPPQQRGDKSAAPTTADAAAAAAAKLETATTS